MRDLGVRGYTEMVKRQLSMYRPTIEMRVLEQVDLGDERVFCVKKPTNEVSSRDETRVRSEST